MHDDTVIHHKSIFLHAPAEAIRRYITDPNKVMDYYPMPWGADVIEPDQSLIVWGPTGACLIEVIEASVDGLFVRLRVSTALIFKQPFTCQRIRDKAFFVMDETLHLKPENGGCRVEKHWMNIVKKRLTWLPMEHIVRFTARGEIAKLTAHWRA